MSENGTTGPGASPANQPNVEADAPAAPDSDAPSTDDAASDDAPSTDDAPKEGDE